MEAALALLGCNEAKCEGAGLGCKKCWPQALEAAGEAAITAAAAAAATAAAAGQGSVPPQASAPRSRAAAGRGTKRPRAAAAEEESEGEGAEEDEEQAAAAEPGSLRSPHAMPRAGKRSRLGHPAKAPPAAAAAGGESDYGEGEADEAVVRTERRAAKTAANKAAGHLLGCGRCRYTAVGCKECRPRMAQQLVRGGLVARRGEGGVVWLFGSG